MKRNRIKISGERVRTSFNLPSELLSKLDKAARDRNVFMSSAVTQAIQNWIDYGEDPTPGTETSLQEHSGEELKSPLAIVETTPGSVYVGYAHQLSKIRKLADQLQQEIEANHILPAGGIEESEKHSAGKKGGAKALVKNRQSLRKPAQGKMT